jgi:hypothetical protein
MDFNLSVKVSGPWLQCAFGWMTAGELRKKKAAAAVKVGDFAKTPWNHAICLGELHGRTRIN